MLLPDWLVEAHDNWSASVTVSCRPAFLRREELGRLWQLGNHYNLKFTGKQRNSTKQTTIQISISSVHIALHGLLWIFYYFAIGQTWSWGSFFDTVSYEALVNLHWLGNITRTLLTNIVMLERISLFPWNLYIYILEHYRRPLIILNRNLLKFSFSFLHYLISFYQMMILMWNYVTLVLK